MEMIFFVMTFGNNVIDVTFHNITQMTTENDAHGTLVGSPISFTRKGIS